LSKGRGGEKGKGAAPEAKSLSTVGGKKRASLSIPETGHLKPKKKKGERENDLAFP